MIALALVELVAASWTELAPAPPSLVAPVLAPPALVVPESHHVRVALTAGALKFSATDPLAGGGVRIADASEFPIGWIVDAQIHSGEQTTSLGDVRAGVLSVGAAAQVHHSWPRARIDLGAGMRGGEVRMVGMATSPGITASAFSSGWLGALVRGQVSVSLSGPITLDAALETGYVLAPVNALVAGRPEVAVDGNWLEVHLGIGVSI
jgi:hypothetical protein